MLSPGPPDDGSFSATVYRMWNRSVDAVSDPRDTNSARQGKVYRALDTCQSWLDPFFANRLGFVMVFYSFVLGYGASLALGYEGGELTQAVGGAVLAAGDLGFRKVRHGARWLQRASGGTLFFLPVFVFGVLWSIVGMYDVSM